MQNQSIFNTQMETALTHQNFHLAVTEAYDQKNRLQNRLQCPSIPLKKYTINVLGGWISLFGQLFVFV